MYERLSRRGFSASVVRETIDSLKANRFLDDRRVAEQLKRYAAEQKCLGRQGTRNYLIKRGIPEALADEVAGQDADYAEQARSIVGKRIRTMKDLDEETIKRRLWGLLMRRGFSSDIVKQTIRSAMARRNEDEDA